MEERAAPEPSRGAPPKYFDRLLLLATARARTPSSPVCNSVALDPHNPPTDTDSKAVATLPFAENIDRYDRERNYPCCRSQRCFPRFPFRSAPPSARPRSVARSRETSARLPCKPPTAGRNVAYKGYGAKPVHRNTENACCAFHHARWGRVCRFAQALPFPPSQRQLQHFSRSPTRSVKLSGMRSNAQHHSVPSPTRRRWL